MPFTMLLIFSIGILMGAWAARKWVPDWPQATVESTVVSYLLCGFVLLLMEQWGCVSH